MIRTTKGIAIPIVVAAVAVMFVVIFTLFHMMRAVGTQVMYADGHLRAMTIAESGVNYLIARFMSHPWEDRWFAEKPDSKAGNVFDQGTWDYYIADTAPGSKTADIWVRGSYRNVRRLIFYRVSYEDRIFRGLTRSATDFSLSVDEEGEKPLTQDMQPLTVEMNRLIEKRESTRVPLRDKWPDISRQVDPSAILCTLGGEMEHGILAKSIPLTPAAETRVVPRPVIPKEAGGRSLLKNTSNPHEIEKWMRSQINISDAMISKTLRPIMHKTISVIDKWYEAEKYLKGEETYKRFHQYILSVPATVETDLYDEQRRYSAELTRLKTAGYADSDELRSAMEAARKRHNDNIENIRSGGTLPLFEPGEIR